MKAPLLAALATLVLTFNGAPADARPLVDADGAATARTIPAGTTEYDAYSTTLRDTLTVTWRNWARLSQCDSWACAVRYHQHIDDALTRGIQWLYHHPALACFQAQQQRATKGLQETRGGFRMLMLAIQTGSQWRQRVATAKITAAREIFDELPAHTCPASASATVQRSGRA